MSKVILTGLNGSTDKINIGHYFGFIKPFVDLQRNNKDDTLIGFVADLHGLTDPTARIKGNSKYLMLSLIAAGFDPYKSIVFNQSDVPAHTELTWVLTCQTTMGELERMTQYKDSVQKDKFLMANGSVMIPTGILMYPVLMAADILLYDSNIIPCGYDQVQHVELARNIAERFNNKYGETFTLPEAQVAPGDTKKIQSLVKPERKMSKSEPEGSLWMLDDANEIERKIKRAMTDNFNKVHFDKVNQPGISNLMVIYSGLTGMSYQEIEEKYKDAPNYSFFKKDLIKILQDELGQYQKRYYEWESKYDEIEKILADNAIKMRELSNKKLDDVYRKVGIKG